MALLIGDVIRNAGTVTPNVTAATLNDDAISYGELDHRSNQVAHVLRKYGVGYGDRVVWWGDTSLEALPIFAAVAKIGAVFAPLNALYGAGEAQTVAGYARPRLVIADAAHAPMTAGWDTRVVNHADLYRDADDASIERASEPALDERDAHVIFFTSGSTGRPKGVILSHRANYLRSIASPINDHPGSTVCMFPLFHMAGWTLAMGSFQLRQPVHFVTRPDADELVNTVERHRATRLYLIPAVWARVLEHEPSGHDLSSLREASTGTSATPPELVHAIRDAFPDTFTNIIYGSTEAGTGTVLGRYDVLRKPGSVGLAAPGVLVRLSGDGEVCLKSEFLMDGYFEQPEATAEALRDGWYHTGDLGALDEEGYLSIVGRARDVLRSGGETVAPLEVEDALRDHPAIVDIAVVGIPDVQWGEVVCAVVVARSGHANELDIEALRAYCKGKLAPFKQPRRVELVEQLPRTPATGQIQRALIVERILSTG
jgi:fatty-acyl-CoA synthase